MTELPNEPTRDNSAGLEGPAEPGGRQRTIFLLIIDRGAEGLELIATGPAIERGGRLPCYAQHRRTAEDVRGEVEELIRIWHEEAVELEETGRGGRTVTPYAGLPAEHLDDPYAVLLRVGGRLAKAGYVLFEQLFAPRAGDVRMEEFNQRLTDALRSGEQIMTVISEDVFAPWAMLYLPPDAKTSSTDIEDDWRPEGFWGYRHLVEHSIPTTAPIRTLINPGGADPVIGVYADTRLDDIPEGPSQSRFQSQPRLPIVRPIVDALGKLRPADLSLVSGRRELLKSMASSDRSEQLTCFVCHGEVGDPGSGSIRKPSLRLADMAAVSVGELESDASKGATLRGSVVFLAVCQGGRLGSFYFDSFPVTFHGCGANCVLGPQVDIPIEFAREYSLALLDRFTEPETRLGDVVRDLARSYLDEHHTPLGLAFTRLGGLDTHFGARTAHAPA